MITLILILILIELKRSNDLNERLAHPDDDVNESFMNRLRY